MFAKVSRYTVYICTCTCTFHSCWPFPLLHCHNTHRCQWVLPCRTNQDCVSEPRQQQKSELVAVSSSLDFHWFSVCEVERVASPEPEVPDDGGRQKQEEEKGKAKEKEEEDEEKEEGSGEGEGVSSSELVIERLAVLKKKDLGTELRHFDCCESLHEWKCGACTDIAGNVLPIAVSIVLCRPGHTILWCYHSYKCCAVAIESLGHSLSNLSTCSSSSRSSIVYVHS